MNLRELTGVLAHEISHIRNNDVWIMGLADMVSRVTGILSTLGQLLVLVNLPLLMLGRVGISWIAIGLLVAAPAFSAVLQLALSRLREYDADMDAAALTRDPRGLAAALYKIERYQGGIWERVLMPQRRNPQPSVLRTHPHTQDRVRRLLALETPEPPVFDTADNMESWRRNFEPPVPTRPRRRASGLWY